MMEYTKQAVIIFAGLMAYYCLMYLTIRAATAAYFRSKIDFIRKVGNMVDEGVDRHGKA